MQSATPQWAPSSGVIKAFKHHHPLSLHMSALQSVFVITGGLHVVSIVYLVTFSLLHYSSLTQWRQEKCWAHFNIYSNNRSFNNKIRMGSAEEDKSGRVAAMLQ